MGFCIVTNHLTSSKIAQPQWSKLKGYWLVNRTTIDDSVPWNLGLI